MLPVPMHVEHGPVDACNKGLRLIVTESSFSKQLQLEVSRPPVNKLIISAIISACMYTYC